MSKTIGQPGQDLPEPVLPGQQDDDAIGQPDREDGFGNDLPSPSEGISPVDRRGKGTPVAG